MSKKYNLQNKVGKKYASKHYTEPQIKKLLENYTDVPPNEWYTIPKGTHIRYETKDGGFRRGGFVQNAYLLKGKKTLHLENSKDQKDAKYAKWPLVLESVGKIWKKRDQDEPVAVPQETKTPAAYNTHIFPEEEDVDTSDGDREQESRISELEKKVIIIEGAIRRITEFLSNKFGGGK